MEWNQQLRDAIPEKFADAIELINEFDNNLRYSWPLLLVPPPKSGEFFRTTGNDIAEEIKKRHILMTEEGHLVTPTDRKLLRFPAKWRFGPDKELPIPSSGVRYAFLSHKYDVDCTTLIGHLGVEEIDIYRFRSEFERFTRDEENLGGKSEAWHIMLAQMLNNDHYLRQYFSNLKIIPVEGGNASWTSSDKDRENLVITSDLEEIRSLPQKIGVLYIPQAASRNKDRHALFEAYGAKGIHQLAGTIATKIREAHSQFDPTSENRCNWTTEDLISHSLFLFRMRMTIRAPDDLWVATTSNEPQLASATFVKPLGFGNAPVLHQGYLTGLPEKESGDLLTWMIKSFKMPESARLVVPDGADFILAPEMKLIAQNGDSIEFLELLRHHWARHSHLLTKENEKFQEKLWNQIVSTKIRCMDSKDHPLGETLLPSSAFDIPKRMAPLPLLPIAQVEDNDWQFVAKLGVQVQPNVDDWLRCLTGMKTSNEVMKEEPDRLLELASFIYSKIGSYCFDSRDDYRIKRMVRYGLARFTPGRIRYLVL